MSVVYLNYLLKCNQFFFKIDHGNNISFINRMRAEPFELTKKRFFTIIYKTGHCIMCSYLLSFSVYILDEAMCNNIEQSLKQYVYIVLPYVVNICATMLTIVILVGDTEIVDFVMKTTIDCLAIYILYMLFMSCII